MHTDKFPLNDVKEEIESATSITILSHLNPDADAIGTALGIYTLFTQDKTKRVEVVNASKVLPQYLDFLPNFKKIKSHIEYKDSLIIACDCGSIDRLGFVLKKRKILNIDHHQSNTRYGTLNIVLPEYASSSQVAFRLLKKFYSVDVAVATCFYTALLSDTRYFTTSSVNEEVFVVAKELLSLGVNPEETERNLTQRRPLSSFRILEKALASLVLKFDAKIATLCVTKEEINATGATIPDMEGIVDYAKSLATVEIALFAMEFDDGIRISLRSKGVDVSKVASVFGGGGHKVTAGFILKQCELQTSIDTILDTIKELGLIE